MPHQVAPGIQPYLDSLKFEKAKVLVQLRERQAFIKPSVRRRGEVLKAVYKQQVAAGKFED